MADINRPLGGIDADAPLHHGDDEEILVHLVHGADQLAPLCVRHLAQFLGYLSGLIVFFTSLKAIPRTVGYIMKNSKIPIGIDN
jgi:hypothetical protein